MRLSVVVATRDRPEFLDECLAILRSAVSVHDEVIVVDSASTATSISEIANARGAELIRCPLPGASLARNVGWRAAKGSWVAFVDDDVRVDPQWAEALATAIAGHPEVSFMTGRLRVDRPTQREVAVFDSDDPMTIDRYTVGSPGHGANFAVRRDALETVGGFDESLGPGARWKAGEDLELIDRLVAAGYTGRYEPNASGYHLQWRSTRDLFGLEWRYGLGQGARLALLRKLDRERSRGVARRTTWELGVVELFQSLLRGWEKIAARAFIRLAGTTVGFVGMLVDRMRSVRHSESAATRTPNQASPVWQPLVSVILPTHDRPERLGGAIRSVLSQTYTNLELLVVDDGSVVPVDEVVAKVAGDDERVRLLRLPNSQGAAGARNAGLEEISGEVVTFLDDDDRWEHGKLSRQVDFFARHPDVGVVSCDYFIEMEGRRRRPVRFRGPERYSTGHLLWINFAGSFSLVAVRAALLKEQMRIDDRFVPAEDWELWLRCSRLAAVGAVREPLVHQVSHGDPRLTDAFVVDPKRALFEQHYGSCMTTACRAFHQAHQQMTGPAGWRRRARVLQSLVTASPAAAGYLVLEQCGRQAGRLLRDPGLPYRLLHRAITRTEGRGR